MEKYRKVDFAKQIIILLYLVFILFPFNSYSQDNPFVIMHDGKFYLGCEEFYPVAVNYGVWPTQATNDTFYISPTNVLCHYPEYCCDTIDITSCGINSVAWEQELIDHLTMMDSLNFNMIRLLGFSIGYRDDNPLWGEVLQSRTYFKQTYENTHCFDLMDGIVMNSNSFSFQGDMLQKVIDVIYENNFSFKLLILMGGGRVEMLSDTYADYLAYMANRFRDEPVIFGYDLYNEPGMHYEEELTKAQIAEKCSTWYHAIKQNAPSHFVTMGVHVLDVFHWDPQILPLDFLSFHLYRKPHVSEGYEIGPALERYKVFLQWISKSFSKPYMIGETSYSGIDYFPPSLPPQHPIIPGEADQAAFADSSLRYTKWYGNIGYSWWYYKDVASHWVTNEKAYSNYYGIVRMEYYHPQGSYDEIYKPLTGNIFINYDPNSISGSFIDPHDTLYHNPNPASLDSVIFSGYVTDGSNGIENVLIRANNANTDNDTVIYENYFAITDNDGFYKICTGLPNSPNTKIRKFWCSYPNGDSFIIEDWNGVTIPSEIILQDLDPTQLPSEPNNETLVIKAGEQVTWDNLQSLPYKEVIIEPGAQLNVLSDTYLNKDAKIVVQRGGELIIDGGGLIGSCMWKGIEVWGTRNQPPTTIGAHGKVEMKNGSVIENALYGIRTIKAEIDPTEGEEMDYNFTGGKVVASGGSVFRNCKFGVRFHAYNYDHHSSFTDITFETTDSILIPNGMPNAGLYFDQVKGITVKGCTFRNTRGDYEVPSDKRGRGIYSFDSNFEVIPYCTSTTSPCPTEYIQPCRFEKLYYGIRAMNSRTAATFTVDTADFINNVRALYAGGVDNILVTRSLFEMGASFYGTRGIYLDECTGYTIEENDFYETENETIGIVVNQSGGNLNEIYLNRFIDTKHGILAQNENRATDGTGLQLKCNEFVDNNYDIAVTYDLYPMTKLTGIAKKQGSTGSQPDAPAGNRFSWTGPTGTPTDINNQTQHLTYYYHVYEFENFEPKYYTQSTVTATANQLAPWIPDQSCPSQIDTTGGGSGSEDEMRGMMASAGLKADSIGQLIQVLEDAGNTENLKWEVDVSTPAQSLEVYNELMSVAPYVSDTVIAAAIEKETVLADAMIRDVMVANPESAKDDLLLQKLDERTNPLPEYMLGQILQGRSLITVYGDLMARQSYYKQQRAFALNRLKRIYLNDTLNPSASLDSLILLLEKENTPGAKYELAFLYAGQGAWSIGQSVLDNIPQQFNLSTEELVDHQNMTGYYGLLQEVNGNVPDSLQLVTLFQLTSVPHGRAAVYARNNLLALEQVNYDEPVIYPDMLKSTEAEEEYQYLIKQAAEKRYLEVFPNPTGDYIIVKWELETSADNILIRIIDNHGRPVTDIKVSGIQNQQVVSTVNFEPGVYIISIYTNNKLLDSEKVSVVK